MRSNVQAYRNEEGFVLVTALLTMLVLTIIGIAATTNTSIELQVAANDKVYKKTFYEAEAGAILGTEIMEQAFSCPTGFSKTATINSVDVADLKPEPDNASSVPVVRVYDRSNDLVLWRNAKPSSYDCDTGPASSDVAYPITNISTGIAAGYITMGGETHMLPGGALQMAAGYEGKGKSAAQGGVSKTIDIYSQFEGLSNSEAVILFGWRHLIGAEGACNYD